MVETIKYLLLIGSAVFAFLGANLANAETQVNTIEVPVLNSNFKAGTIISLEDITTKTLNRVNSKAVTTKAELIGKEVKGFIRSNSVIYQSQIRVPPMVKRGQAVTVNYNRGGINLQIKGKVLEDGNHNDLVRVSNIKTKHIINAVVTGMHTVKVIQ